jgi:hypothetical protein
MARARGARSQFAAAFETTYGTPPASGFLQFPFASSAMGMERPLLASELLGEGRDPTAPVLDAPTVSGDIEAPICARGFGHWLRALFGPPITSTGAGPYTHTFASGGWALPSLAMELGLPDAARFAMYAGVRADTLNFSMQRSGLLTARIGLVGRSEAVAGTTAAGTPTAIALNRFVNFGGQVKRNGTALGNIVSAEVSYSNNLDPIETLTADGWIENADAGMATMSGSLVVRFADATLLTQALAGDPCKLEFVMTKGAASLTFAAEAVYLPAPRVEIAGPGGVQVTFDWQAAKAAGSPNRMATVTLVNDIVGTTYGAA